MSLPGSRARSRRRPSYGPSVAAFIVAVTVFSFAGAWALDGIPDSETGLFSMMGVIAGLHLAGITVASAGWLLVARVAGVAMIISLIAVGVTRRRLGRARGRA